MRALAAAGLLWLALSAACATRPIEPIDLSRPGWTEWRGQAVWRPGDGRPPLAGEVLLARHAGGDVLVEFAKPPFPVFTATTRGRSWRIDLVEGGRSRAGGGAPPRRFVWFHLPAVLAGEPPPAGWTVERRGEAELSLAHASRGESIRLVLDP